MAGEPGTRARSIEFELFLLGLLAFLWGASYGLTKIHLETIAPMTGVALRMAIGGALMWLVVGVRRLSIPAGRRLWWDLVVQGFIAAALPLSLVAWGQQYVDSGLTSILSCSSPIFVFLITWLWTRHEAVTLERVVGLVVGLGGVVLVIGVDALRGIDKGIIGQLVIVLSTLCFAFAYFWGRRFDKVPPLITAAGTATAAALWLAPLCWLTEWPWQQPPNASSWAALLCSAVFATAGGYLLYYRLLTTLGSIGTASVGYVKAVFAVLLGCLLLGEPFTWAVLTGLVAVVIGVAAINGQITRALTAMRRRGELRNVPTTNARPAPVGHPDARGGER